MGGWAAKRLGGWAGGHTIVSRRIVPRAGRADGRADGWGAGYGSSAYPLIRLSALCGFLLAAGPSLAAAQQSRLLVIQGIPGDSEHQERFTGWSRQMISGAERVGVPAGNIIYLSDQPGSGGGYTADSSTKTVVERTFRDLASKAAPDDVIMVVLIGHGSAQGTEARFNLPGPDLTASDFARLLDGFRTQRVGFVNAASASGDFVAALSGKNRAIVTATRSGGEKNETVFAQYFTDAYARDVADADKDGKVSLLEAFDYARREVARFYETEHRIQTEHAMLDDNGDKEGSREPNPSTGDGGLARRFIIGGGSGAPIASGDSTLAPLYAEVRKLEEQVAELRGRKDSMKPDDYDRQLEDLLVQLSEKNAEIRAKEKKS